MRARLFISFLLVILLSLAGVTWFVRQSTRNEVQLFLGRGGLIGAETLVEELENWYEAMGSWEGAEALLPGTNHGGGKPDSATRGTGSGRLASLRLADASGKIIFDPANPQAAGLAEEDLAYGIPLMSSDTIAGYLLPREGDQQENAQFEDRFMSHITSASVYAAAISGIAALALAILLAYFLVKPVNILVKAAEKIAGGDLSHRVDIRQPKELVRLGNTFNQMALSLEEADRKRKNLSADIAHELRTPLAVQRAQLEAQLDGVYPINKKNTVIVLSQNELLSRLVEDLRTLTLTDSGELELNLHPLDMGKLIGKVAGLFSAKAREKQIEMVTELEECEPVLADEERVQQVLNNLLQNAMRHTPEKGTIYLKLSSRDNQAVITVRDTGAGIPEDSLPYIFDRFYRAERSRSREEGGSGLGLAIARNLAEAQGGSLSASNHPGGGAVFELKLPLAR